MRDKFILINGWETSLKEVKIRAAVGQMLRGKATGVGNSSRVFHHRRQTGGKHFARSTMIESSAI